VILHLILTLLFFVAIGFVGFVVLLFILAFTAAWVHDDGE